MNSYEFDHEKSSVNLDDLGLYTPSASSFDYDEDFEVPEHLLYDAGSEPATVNTDDAGATAEQPVVDVVEPQERISKRDEYMSHSKDYQKRTHGASSVDTVVTKTETLDNKYVGKTNTIPLPSVLVQACIAKTAPYGITSNKDSVAVILAVMFSNSRDLTEMQRHVYDKLMEEDKHSVDHTDSFDKINKKLDALKRGLDVNDLLTSYTLLDRLGLTGELPSDPSKVSFDTPSHEDIMSRAKVEANKINRRRAR